MAERWIYDVVCGSAGARYTCDVPSTHLWWQAEKGDRLEGIGVPVGAGWNSSSQFNGYCGMLPLVRSQFRSDYL